MTGIQPGAIRVTAFLAGDAVQRLSIAADRPVSLASALIGRPIGFVGEAVAALHGLCGQSHAAAIRFAAAAAAAAGSTKLPEDEIIRWVIRLAGERLAEHLRCLFTPGGDLAVLRAAVVVGQGAARSGVVPADDVSRAAAAVFALTIMAGETCSRLTPVSWPDLFRPSTTSLPIVPQVVNGWDKPGHDTFNGPAAIDVLTAEDDRTIIAALAADPGFIRTPYLPGRTPETGPAARFGLSAANPDAALAARRAEIREAFALLVNPGLSESWIRSGSIGPNAGYAAVETPRGRLYYRIVLDDNQMLLDARVLAPTEWNFHPNGPLTRTLIGYRPGPDPVASITRRAAAFDPCVELRVAVESLSDA